MGAQKVPRGFGVTEYRVNTEIEMSGPAQNVVGDGFEKAGGGIEGAVFPSAIPFGGLAGLNLAGRDNEDRSRARDAFTPGDPVALRAARKSGDHELFMEMSRVSVVEEGRAQQFKPVRQAAVLPQADLVPLPRHALFPTALPSIAGERCAGFSNHVRNVPD